MIHPPDVVEKYAPDATTGTLWEGGEDDGDEEEVAKNNKKDGVWVVLNGRVLNGSTFLSQHPGVMGSGKSKKMKGVGRSAPD